MAEIKPTLEWEVQYRQYFANADHWAGVGKLPYGTYDLAASGKHETPEDFARALVQTLHDRNLLPKGGPADYRITIWDAPGKETLPILTATWGEDGSAEVQSYGKTDALARRYWRSLTGSRKTVEVTGRGRAGARHLLEAEPPRDSGGAPLETGGTLEVWRHDERVDATIVGFRIDEWGEHVVLETNDGTEMDQPAYWQTEA